MQPGYYAVNLGKSNGETPERRRMCQEALPSLHIPDHSSPEVQAMIGCSVGVAKVEHSLPCNMCEGDVWKNDAGVCNVISQVGWFDRPVPVRGNFGTFPVKDGAALAAVRAQAANATLFETQGDKIYKQRYSWTTKRKRGAIDLDNAEEREQLRAFLENAIAANRRKIKEASESVA
jgi:hypothetical protein